MYTCDEVAERYKVKIITVWDWIRQRKLNAIKLGREYRISEEDLIEFENERKTIQTKHQITYLQQMKQVSEQSEVKEMLIGTLVVLLVIMIVKVIYWKLCFQGVLLYIAECGNPLPNTTLIKKYAERVALKALHIKED